MKFGHRCKEARWNEETSKWHVTFDVLNEHGNVLETFADVGDVMMTGTGVLNEWKWPDIPGLKSFKGKLLHSANYDDSFSMTVSAFQSTLRSMLTGPGQEDCGDRRWQ